MTRSILVALCLVLAPSLAAAQSSSAVPTATSPAFRLDVGFPDLGVGASTFDPGVLGSFGGHVALAHRSGHGGRIGFAFLTPSSGQLFGPHRAHGEGWVIDASYLYRVRLAGDDRLGLGLDLSSGLSTGMIDERPGTNGLCFGGCPTPEPEAQNVPDGANFGWNAGASLDLRVYGFTLGLDVRYRGLFALEPGVGRIDQHAVSAIGYLGFGFW